MEIWPKLFFFFFSSCGQGPTLPTRKCILVKKKRKKHLHGHKVDMGSQSILETLKTFYHFRPKLPIKPNGERERHIWDLKRRIRK